MKLQPYLMHVIVETCTYRMHLSNTSRRVMRQRLDRLETKGPDLGERNLGPATLQLLQRCNRSLLDSLLINSKNIICIYSRT